MSDLRGIILAFHPEPERRLTDAATTPLCRSALYVPAANRRALEKAPTLGADVVIADLEDAVAPDAKPAARSLLRESLAGPRARRMVVRVNAVDTPFLDDDLALVAETAPDAVLLPKPGSADDVRHLADAIGRHRGPPGMRLWLMIESVAVLTHLDAIVAAGLASTPRLEALVVGTNDLAKETGVDPGDGRRYLLPWLMDVVRVGKHRGLLLLDGVWNDFGDTAGFEAELRQSVAMGFDGKTLIHPSQLAPTHRAFAPSAAALAEARSIVDAFARPEHAGAGVIRLDGRMVERLHLAQAERLLAKEAAIQREAPPSPLP